MMRVGLLVCLMYSSFDISLETSAPSQSPSIESNTDWIEKKPQNTIEACSGKRAARKVEKWLPRLFPYLTVRLRL